MNYPEILAPFFDSPQYRLQAVRAHRAWLNWQKREGDRKLQKLFVKELYRLPVEF